MFQICYTSKFETGTGDIRYVRDCKKAKDCKKSKIDSDSSESSDSDLEFQEGACCWKDGCNDKTLHLVPDPEKIDVPYCKEGELRGLLI